MNVFHYVQVIVTPMSLDFTASGLACLAKVGEAAACALELFGIPESPKVFALMENGELVPSTLPSGMVPVQYYLAIGADCPAVDDLQPYGRVYHGTGEADESLVNSLKVPVCSKDLEGNLFPVHHVTFSTDRTMYFESVRRQREAAKRVNGGNGH